MTMRVAANAIARHPVSRREAAPDELCEGRAAAVVELAAAEAARDEEGTARVEVITAEVGESDTVAVPSSTVM
jgi:hypothetical protein